MTGFYTGLRLGQRYVLDQPIGAGGMSQVWGAVDEVLDRKVAVKTLDAPLAEDPAMRTAIRQEARAAARIAHPHVCQIYDFGEADLPGDGVAPYLVMEHLDGENLADRLRGGPLPWRRAVEVCAQVAAALAAAHSLDVVHRDIKPANVMLTGTGAKVVDFGIAAVARDHGDSPARRAGTPAFLAPEVLLGAPASAQSDVYSLGALLHAALTGETLVGVMTWPEAARAHERGLAVARLDVPDLPEDVRELCARCLSSAPDSRPTSVEAATMLAATLRSTPGSRRTPAAPPAPRASEESAAAPGRGIGRAKVRAPAMALTNPTLLDATSPAVVRSATRATAEGAAVASGRRRSDVPVALLATAALVAGVFVLVGTAAFLRGQTGADAAGGTESTRAPVVVTTPAAPDDPRSPAGVVTALETEIASALLSGSLDAVAALRLADDLRSLEQRIEAGRDKDVRRRAEDMRDRIDEWVNDGELGADLGTRLDQLLQTLIRLTGAED